jgi:hypothetical protein
MNLRCKGMVRPQPVQMQIKNVVENSPCCATRTKTIDGVAASYLVRAVETTRKALMQSLETSHAMHDDVHVARPLEGPTDVAEA